MTLVAHLADLHLGYSHLNLRATDGRNQRLADFEGAALACAEHLARLQPDLVVVAGDLCHETQLYPAALSGAVRFCELLRDIPIVVIGGNHDEAEGENRFNALRFLAQHHGIDLHLAQGHVDVCGLRLHTVSFRVLSRAQRGRTEIGEFEFSSELPNVLVTHGYAPGEGVPDIAASHEVRIPDSWLTEPRFEAALLGHIHTHTRLRRDGNAFYSGSTERRNFGEAAERPGFWLHHFEDGALAKSESVFVDQISDELPRPMHVRQIDCSGLTIDELDRQIEYLIDEVNVERPGAMMRVTLDNVSSELDRHDARRRWSRRLLDGGGIHFEAEARSRQMAELMAVEFAGPPADVGSGLLEFIGEQKVDSEEVREELSQIAEDVVAEARELILAQEAD